MSTEGSVPANSSVATRNWKTTAVVAGSAILLAAAAGYMYYSSSSGSATSTTSKSRRKKNKKNKKSKKAASESEDDGEDENASTTAAGTAGAAAASSSDAASQLDKTLVNPATNDDVNSKSASPSASNTRAATVEDKSHDDSEPHGAGGRAWLSASVSDASDAVENMTDARIATLSNSRRKEFAAQLKSKGNKYYTGKMYKAAIRMYSDAIRFDPHDAVFFSNRAACHLELNNYAEVIEDCTEALRLKPRYTKALLRRATAYEHTEKFRDALYDVNTALIVEEFNNSKAAESAERLVGKIAKAEAKERFATRTVRLPSTSFVTSYINSVRAAFAEFAAPAGVDAATANEAVKHYLEALSLVRDHKYTEANTAIDAAISTHESIMDVEEDASADGGLGKLAAHAYNIRGTFRYLMGTYDTAIADFKRSLDADPTFLQSHLKMASVHTDRGNFKDAVAAVDNAFGVDATSPEVHFARGQILFVNSELQGALEEYKKSTELDNGWLYSRVQAAMVKLRLGKDKECNRDFKVILKDFADRGDAYNFYAEVLAEQQKFDEALELLDSAVKYDPTNPLPYVNMAVIKFQTTQDPQEALTLYRKALEIDPDCEVAVAALSQLYMQLGLFEESIELLERAVELSKSEDEMISAISFRESTEVQFRVLKEHPDLLAKIMQQGAAAAAAGRH